MPRSTRKGPFIDKSLFDKVVSHQQGKTKGVINTKSRRSMVVPTMEGLTIGVHNGREYVNVFIIAEMIGHKLGEFAPTRKPPKHSDKKS